MKLIECVPNFSEGRKPEVIERLAAAVEAVAGVVVLNVHRDPDHNRSVITFAGEPEPIAEAAFRAAGLAAELIDLRTHQGVHPRLGATDVMPFVPIREVTMEECIALAHRTGERIANELGIPVYFYERAALRPARVNLEDVRRGGFELLQTEISLRPERAPDAGEPRIHATAGATIVGARPFLIAFNVNLRTDDVGIARRIAHTVRGRDGGLRFLKALGFDLPTQGLVQVSMNLVDYEKTGLARAFAAVKAEAERLGVQLAGSEIVGLVPQAALDQAAEYFLQIPDFHRDLVIENRIEGAFARSGGTGLDFIGQVASAEPAPGGGAAAAHVAALAAALGEMQGRLTLGRERFAEVESEVNEAVALLGDLRQQLLATVNEDSESFRRVIEARRAARQSAGEDEGVKGRRGEGEGPRQNPDRQGGGHTAEPQPSGRGHGTDPDHRIEEALKAAATVPLEVASLAVQVLETIETLAEIGNPVALSDAATGAQMALAAVASARYNVLVNVTDLDDDEFAAEHRSRVGDLLDRAKEISERVEALLFASF
jgi:glutamate formiminotransferase/formiminotetrahydrofolate cyclodeaminase